MYSLNSNKLIREIKGKKLLDNDLNQQDAKYKISILRSSHKIIDGINLSIIILIFILSFVSLKSQREWTKLYSNMIDLRNKNNNIIDYISKTEEYFLKQIELKENMKNTNPEDLIYLTKTKNQNKRNFILFVFKEMKKGLKDGIYQRGY